jgi:hypothetical protein
MSKHRAARLHGWSVVAVGTLTAIGLLLTTGSPTAFATTLCGSTGAVGSSAECSYTTQGEDFFVVPGGVTSLHVTAVAGSGGSGGLSGAGSGGAGAEVSADVPVTAGATEYIDVGVGGGTGGAGGNASGAGGNGGGPSGIYTCSGNGATSSCALLVAGGGGGGGGGDYSDDVQSGNGGDGGTGSLLCNPGTGGGTGVYVYTGGGSGGACTTGVAGTGGTGTSASIFGSGGGGGGYYGGAGGGVNGSYGGAGGGGGSSFAAAGASNVSMVGGAGGPAVTITWTAPPTPTTPSIGNLPASGIFGGGFTASVTTNGDGATSVSSDTPGICSASGLIVSYVGTGICSLAAHVAAGTHYGAADGNPQTVTIGAATPSTPSIGNLPASGVDGGGFTATVTTNGDGPTSVSSATPDICTASGLTVSYVGPGICSLTAHVAAGNDYGAADGSPQTIAIDESPAAPTAVSAEAGDGQAVVGFTAPVPNGGSPITAYTVTAADATADANGGQTCIWTSGPLSCTVTGLADGDSYTFTVTGTNGAGTGPPSTASNSVVPTGPPGAPSEVTALAGDGQATVAFAAPASEGGSAISAYTVTAADSTTDGNGGQTCTWTAGPLTCTVAGLTNGDSYTFTVTATNSVGTGPASAASNPVTPVTLPGAPESPAATAGGASATVTWSEPTSDGGSIISTYTVTAVDATTAANGGQTCTWTSGPLSCTVAGLTNGDSYTFTVTAANAVGTGPASDPSNAVAPATAPSVPGTPIATAGAASATVTWSEPASDGGSTITAYTVTAADATASANGGQTCTWTSGPLSCTVTGLKNGDSYTFTVTAGNGAGTGPSSDASNAVTPVAPPGAPESPIATVGAASATVTWSEPASDGGSTITAYTVTAADATASANGGQTCTWTSGPLSCTVTGLKNGDSYTFTVTATNAVGTGPASVASNAVSPAAAPAIGSFTPRQGIAGTHVTITGTGFSATPTVTFADGSTGVAAALVSHSATKVVVQVPATAVNGLITVTTAYGTASSALNFAALPSVSGFSGEPARFGDTVTVHGANLTANGSLSAKLGTLSLTAGSPTATTFTVQIADGAATGPLTVKNLNGSASSGRTLLHVLPTIAASSSWSSHAGGARTVVSVPGHNFTGTSRVTVGGVAAAFSVPSSQTLKLTISAAAVSGPIAVTNAGGTTTSADDYAVEPTITSFAPVAAVGLGRVTISGTGLAGATAVDFNGDPSPSLGPNTATSLVAEVPVDATNGPITVTTPAGTTQPSVASFKPSPRIVGITGDPAQAGTTVTVAGTDLTASGALTAKLGTLAVTPMSVTATGFQFVVPVAAATGALSVKNGNGTAAPVTVHVRPTISGDPTPNESYVGQTIVLSGETFTGTTSVKFGGNSEPAKFTVVSPTSLRATIPAAATSGQIGVTNGGGTTLTVHDFTVDPHITDFSPHSGPTGTVITATGTGLSGATTVEFAGGVTATPTNVAATSLKVGVPAGGGSGTFTVHTAAGTATSPTPFTVTAGVTSISPATAPAGAPVEIGGAGFAGVTAVRFTGAAATVFHVDSTAQITVIVPPGATTGPVSVVTSAETMSSGAHTFTPEPAAAGTVDVSTDADVVNGDTSSISALLASPGLDGISFTEALMAANNTPGTDRITISFASALAGTSIVFAGPEAPPPISRDDVTIDGITSNSGDPEITLDGSKITIAVGTIFVRASHVEVENLEFTNVVSNGAALVIGAGPAIGFSAAPSQTADVTVDGNVFSNVGVDQHARAINVSASSIASGTEISNVTISDNAFVHYRNDDTLGIGAPGTDNKVADVTVSGNSFTDTELAVEMAVSGGTNGEIDGTTILRNTFTNDPQPISILTIDNPPLTSSGNTIDGTDISGNRFLGTTGPEIAISGGIGASTNNVVSNTTIDNNLLMDGDGVFATGGSSGATGNEIDGLKLSNDTFTSTSHGLYTTAGDSGNSVGASSVANTIFSNVGFPLGHTDASVAYSLFSGTCDDTYVGVNDNLCADPEFVDPSHNDFHLQEGSPAIDAGTSDGAPATDLECLQRHDDPLTPNSGGGNFPYYDIGAFEYGGAPGNCPSS